MKTTPPVNPEPLSGPHYWRSLDQLADTPAFREWVEREFPAAASECQDPINRRHFLKIMSASFLLAGVGLTGCRRPVETIYPFAKQPENFAHGVPQYYATAMPRREGALPLVVKANDGRPTKIEGNDLHPDSRGATDLVAQASILDLYDPDRTPRFTRNGSDVSREAALDFLTQLSNQLAENKGQGLAVLLERGRSPTRARLQTVLSEKFPQAHWFAYEAVDFHPHWMSASIAAGAAVKPYYRTEAARVIVSLDADFMGGEEDTVRLIRGFADGRAVEKPTDPLNRLYIVEGLMTMTGMNADHRLRVPASAVLALAGQLAAEVARQSGQAAQAEFTAALQPLLDGAALQRLSEQQGKTDPQWIQKWIAGCAQDLLAHRGESLVMAGHRQPVAVHLLAQALNEMLGNSGKTVLYVPAEDPPTGNLNELAQLLNAGQVSTLVILGGNPVYNAPSDLAWAKTQRQARTVVRLGYYEDETFPVCDWHLPAAHYLESWGDGRSGDGTVVAIQPLIEPLFGGLTELEVLARLGNLEKTAPYDLVRDTFRSLVGEGDFEGAWRKFLHDGFLAGSTPKPIAISFNWAAVAKQLSSTQRPVLPQRDNLEVIFHRDYRVDDGRYNNNGWLQELPDPVTKMTWENAVLLSRKTAVELGVYNGDRVEIRTGSGTVEGPVWIQPGMADHTLGLALGYGRERTGRIGRGAGFNAYRLRSSQAPYFAVGVKVSKTGRTHRLACTQDHWSMEGRPIIREATLKQYTEQPRFAKGMDMEHPPSTRPLYPNPLDKLKANALHQWGMAIDLNRCVGCATCMMACQSENNIPIVGKEQVGKGREMHWIRIDRYYTGEPVQQADKKPTATEADQQFQKWIDDPQVVNQPMLCQHCESAPCENVCPVNATVHDDEGLNLMAYNRCVGTRYCSNNCPYKVRRFNYFDYNKRPIQDHQLYLGPLATKPVDEWELLKLVKNPDVTVRMRGVMEKCTYCLQRIEQAKIAQKVKAGGSNDVVVPSDSFQTACQQACPAEAIVFGNVADPNSRVSRLKILDRDYGVLEFLSTKPRTTYLARVRNPNPGMPDYYELPLSTQEYRHQNAVEDHTKKD